MTDPLDEYIVTVCWRPADRVPAPTMSTVLLCAAGHSEPVLGYWDGDRWYTSDGEPCSAVSWWSSLPPLPPLAADDEVLDSPAGASSVPAGR